jgi:hypothetical protein
MYNPDTDLLFPARVIPALADLRGDEWRTLVEGLQDRPSDDPEVVNFVWMMIGLNSCLGCDADSFRAMRGCTDCAQQAIRRYKGQDAQLIRKFEKAQDEVARRKNAQK